MKSALKRFSTCESGEGIAEMMAATSQRPIDTNRRPTIDARAEITKQVRAER